MQRRTLGSSGLSVSAIGLGCMGMSDFYDPGQRDDAESIRVIHRYLDAGGNFRDTSDTYGVGRNEEPGTKHAATVDENLRAAEITLSSADMVALEEVFPLGVAQGERYNAQGMATVNQ
jgi:aryl-alcohol dehydrogenase-like predicted oxidoreductase